MTDHSQKNETERKRAGLFEEDNGKISSMRLMSFIALIEWKDFIYAINEFYCFDSGNNFWAFNNSS